MSQQISYDTSPAALPARVTRGTASAGADALAKQKLRQLADAARQQRKGGQGSKDILSELLG